MLVIPIIYEMEMTVITWAFSLYKIMSKLTMSNTLDLLMDIWT